MSELYCETHTHTLRRAIQNKKAWNADIRYIGPPWKRASVYSCSHSCTAGAFQLGVVWPPSSQPWSHSEWPPPIYVPEELAVITTLQKNNELMERVRSWLTSHAADFFVTGIQFSSPIDKCQNSGCVRGEVCTYYFAYNDIFPSHFVIC
jgi:hypothetical protein